MTIGERIEQKRIELGWSRSRLAEEAGVPYQSLGSLESGDQRSSTAIAVMPQDYASLGVRQVMRYLIVAATIAICSCSGISTRPCPGDAVGELACNGIECHGSYEGEVFYRLATQPPQAAQLLRLINLGPLASQGWYVSNTGKFRLYVGSSMHGRQYEFTKTDKGWASELTEDGYQCID